MSNEEKKLDEVVEALEKEGVSATDSVDNEGIGDKVSKVFSFFGITPDTVQNWLGIKECGCKKRQKFLNGVLKEGKGFHGKNQN
jgi:hypothetical protein|tara:strand:+ start:577 stop:828 length:252 start_codon:yes stop_codon:yes gene_type:complete